MRQLQLKYRVYAIDLFGFGDSSKNPERYTINQQIELIDDFMKQLGIPKAAFLAHGLGAHVAIEFAKQYPDRVARMLLSSAPVFDSGDLATRVRPGQRVILTNKATSINPTINSPLMDSTIVSRPPAPAVKPLADDGETEILVTGLDKSTMDATVVSANRDTIVNPSLVIDREKLRQMALVAAKITTETERPPVNPKAKDDAVNPLRDALNQNMADLLGRCFKKSETEYEKLQADVTKSDNTVLKFSTIGFDAGMMLDTIRLLTMPVVLVHGEDDPIITSPKEAVWDYLTIEKEEQVLPVPMPGVRHFPMLESDTFQRLVGMFLETPEISKIELKERWRRRSR